MDNLFLIGAAGLAVWFLVLILIWFINRPR